MDAPPKRVAPGEPGTIWTETNDHITWIVFDGTSDLNQGSPTMYAEMYENLCAFRDDDNARVAILAGAGERCFSSGGDLKTLDSLSGEAAARERTMHFWNPRSTEPRLGPQIAEQIFTLDIDKPVIAAVHGYCLGAGLIWILALTDIRIAADDATFGFAEIKRGFGGAAGLSNIAHNIPYIHAAWLCLTGETMDATEAQRCHLVNEVVPRDSVFDRAVELANLVAANSPVVLKMEKELLRRSLDGNRHDVLRLAWALQYANQSGHDAMEGLEAFWAKRPPEFEGW